MVDTSLLDALPEVQDLAGRKANAFVRRCGLSPDEREDVESQLVLRFLVRWRSYDGAKASVRTFASRVMDSELASMLRYRLAASRQAQELPTEAPSLILEALGRFRIDFERALAPLPPVVRETAHTLTWASTTEAADELRCSRQMISRRKQQIRNAFIAGGIGPDYFRARGSQ